MTTHLPVTLDDVRAAAGRIAGEVVRTPCLRSETLSRIAKADVWIKFENLQFTASFKERGALNTLLQLDAEERKRGVIAMRNYTAKPVPELGLFAVGSSVSKADLLLSVDQAPTTNALGITETSSGRRPTVSPSRSTKVSTSPESKRKDVPRAVRTLG